MLLTQCAVCATELGLSLGKKCGRCSTRYCGPECQKQHWEEGGHDKLCRQIKKAGGAEQFHANQKYAEAVAVAAEECAEDTKGQKCYICLEAVHPRTGEGLVRGCACGDRDGVASGITGIAHVSCLMEQAKTLVAEAEENNLGNEGCDARFKRWYTCSLCGQDYHGVVKCALGWACWRTYLGRSEQAAPRRYAMVHLGSALCEGGHDEDASSVCETQLSMLQRDADASEEEILYVKSNLANSYGGLKRHEEALGLRRELYARAVALGYRADRILHDALDLAISLTNAGNRTEAKSFIREQLPKARRALGEEHEVVLRFRSTYAHLISVFTGVTRDDLDEAVTILAELDPMTRRIYGPAHPFSATIQSHLKHFGKRLVAFDTVSLRFAVGARVYCTYSDGASMYWEEGRVLTHHYHEDGFDPGKFVPYQVELDNGLCVYAPEDCDDYIREWHAPGPIAVPSEGDATITVPQGAGATLDLMSTGGRLFSIPVPAGLGAGERFRVRVDSARNSVFCALLSGVPVMNCGTPLTLLVKKGR